MLGLVHVRCEKGRRGPARGRPPHLQRPVQPVGTVLACPRRGTRQRGRGATPIRRPRVRQVGQAPGRRRTMNFASTLLLCRPNAPYTQILAISRGDDLSDWGLVGGKVEPNESLMDAIIREAYEESGVTFGTPGGSPEDAIIRKAYENSKVTWGYSITQLPNVALTPVYTGLAKTRMCTTFMATHANIPEKLPTSREGTVKWLTPHHIVSSRSTYHEYNRTMFAHMRIPMAFEGNPE
ncbi:MAG: NUDIX hydrolase [Myxococcales bacterium]|nr:MAG: NUDIX hydrolase [Myxococcales bacterium]